MSTKTERITARVPENVHVLLQRAAVLRGATINQFIVQAAIERARQIVAEENAIVLSEESARIFFDALENPPAPNSELLAAARAHRDLLNAEN